MTLIRDKDKQELVSREKKDRRDFEQIAALASQMGLHRYIPGFRFMDVLYSGASLTKLLLAAVYMLK